MSVQARPVFRLALLDYQDFPSHDATRISSRAAAESRLLVPEQTYEHVLNDPFRRSRLALKDPDCRFTATAISCSEPR